MIVNISLLINDINDFSETKMEYKLDFYIYHYWVDPRLAFEVEHNVTVLPLDSDQIDKIWLPDTLFNNAKDLNVHKIVSSGGTSFGSQWADGKILFQTRIGLTAKCPMDLSYFPLDQQKCSLRISSRKCFVGVA